MPRRVPRDLILVLFLTCVAVVLTWLPLDAPLLRVVSGALLVLVLPGYAVSKALFPVRSIGAPELVALTTGLSVALAACGAVLLNVTPWGITAYTWTVFLAALTLIGCAVALARRQPAEAEIEPSPPEARRLASGSQIAILALAAVILGAAVWVARLPTPQLPEQGYTLLWALPRDGAPDVVRFGIQSMEASTTAYLVRVESDGRVLTEHSLELQPVQAWESEVSASVSSDSEVRVVLFRADAPNVAYREVVLRATET